MSDDGDLAYRPSVSAAARSLRLDAALAALAPELSAAGIPFILIKGRSIAVRLYDPDEPRPFADLDLLVPAGRHAMAIAVLEGCGFVNEDADRKVLRAVSLLRQSDGVAVDLHFSLFGATSAPERVWAALRPHVQPLDIAGVAIPSLDDSALAVVVALHAAQHQAVDTRPQDDLRRAIARISREAWLEASALAADLGATQSLAASLSEHAEGRVLLQTIGVPFADRGQANADAGMALRLQVSPLGRMASRLVPEPVRHRFRGLLLSLNRARRRAAR